MGAEAVSKRCVVCTRDVSGVPRVKDAKGRYFCESCWQKAKPKGEGSGSGPHPAGAGAVSRPGSAGGRAGVGAGAGAGGAALADDPDGLDGGLGLSSDMLDEALNVASRACPSCRAPMPGGQVVCMGCGFNTQTGSVLATSVNAPEAPAVAVAKKDGRCPKCNYDLRGVVHRVCPECGTPVRNKTLRDELKADAERAARRVWVRPTVMTLVGLAFACVFTGVWRGPEAVALYLIVYGVSLVVGVVVFFMCSVLWIGFDEPMWVVALRIAGVYAAVDAVGAACGPLLAGLFRAIGLGLLYVYLLTNELQIDRGDAMIVAVVTFFAKVATYILLLAYLMSLTQP